MEHAALLDDRLGDTHDLGERMPAARLGVTADQGFIGRFEKIDLYDERAGCDLLQRRFEADEELPVAHIDDHRHIAGATVLPVGQIEKLGQQRHGQVVDNKEPLILQGTGSGGFSRPGKTGDDDQPLATHSRLSPIMVWEWR